MRCLTLPATDARTKKDFLRLPSRVYEGDPHYVPPVGREVERALDTTRNPYFRHADLDLFVTYRDGVATARAALVADRRRIRRDGLAQFGFFEALPHEDATADLFDTMIDYALAAGARGVEGPYSPHHYGQVGLQIDCFDRAPALFQPHHPPWYATLLEQAGLHETKRLHTRRNPDAAGTVRRRHPIRRLLTKTAGLVARPFDARRRVEELERMREVYEDAFADNWRFLPVGADEYAYSARHLGMVTKPEHVVIVEADGEPVAVLQCALDVSSALRRLGGRIGPWRWCRFCRERRRVKDLVVVAVGIKRAWQRTRALRLVYDAMCRLAQNTRRLETTWIAPENRVVQQMCERIGLVKDRTYAMYALDLEVTRATA